MKKQADWKESLKNFLQEHRQAVGVAAAAGAGGLIGGSFLPGLIYKKPTWGSRFMLGGGSAALTALAVMAALGKGEDIPTPGAKPLKQALSTIKEIPGSFAGGMPTAKQFQNMGGMQRALYGKEGQGALSWAVRQLKRAMPSYRGLSGSKSQDDTKREKAGLQFPTSDYSVWDSIGAYGGFAGGLGAGYGTQKLLGGMAQNYNRAQILSDLIRNAKNADKGVTFATLPKWTQDNLDLLQTKADRSSVSSLWQLLKAHGMVGRHALSESKLGKKIMPKSWIPDTQKVLAAYDELDLNPFRLRAAANSSRTTNPLLNSLAKDTQGVKGLEDLTQQLGKNRKYFDMPKVRGLRRIGRLGRKGLPVLAGLITSGLINNWTGANKDYDAMVSQKLYQGMDK